MTLYRLATVYQTIWENFAHRAENRQPHFATVFVDMGVTCHRFLVFGENLHFFRFFRQSVFIKFSLWLAGKQYSEFCGFRRSLVHQTDIRISNRYGRSRKERNEYVLEKGGYSNSSTPIIYFYRSDPKNMYDLFEERVGREYLLENRLEGAKCGKKWKNSETWWMFLKNSPYVVVNYLITIKLI